MTTLRLLWQAIKPYLWNFGSSLYSLIDRLFGRTPPPTPPAPRSLSINTPCEFVESYARSLGELVKDIYKLCTKAGDGESALYAAREGARSIAHAMPTASSRQSVLSLQEHLQTILDRLLSGELTLPPEFPAKALIHTHLFFYAVLGAISISFYLAAHGRPVMHPLDILMSPDMGGIRRLSDQSVIQGIYVIISGEIDLEALLHRINPAIDGSILSQPYRPPRSVMESVRRRLDESYREFPPRYETPPGASDDDDAWGEFEWEFPTVTPHAFRSPSAALPRARRRVHPLAVGGPSFMWVALNGILFITRMVVQGVYPPF